MLIFHLKAELEEIGLPCQGGARPNSLGIWELETPEFLDD